MDMSLPRRRWLLPMLLCRTAQRLVARLCLWVRKYDLPNIVETLILLTFIAGVPHVYTYSLSYGHSLYEDVFTEAYLIPQTFDSVSLAGVLGDTFADQGEWRRRNASVV